jgi:hypothetical protein
MYTLKGKIKKGGFPTSHDIGVWVAINGEDS